MNPGDPGLTVNLVAMGMAGLTFKGNKRQRKKARRRAERAVRAWLNSPIGYNAPQIHGDALP